MFKQKLKIRNLIQLVFTLIVLYIGVTFVLFVTPLKNGLDPKVTRPAGVEAFLPIDALIGLKVWLTTGIFDWIHPAGLVIFLAALVISIFFKRAFCSWICPLGTLAEGLAKVGKKLMGRNLIVPRWLDYLLRTLKYLLLSLFLVFILGGMSSSQALVFLQSDYNMITDVKMLRFFQNLSGTGIIVVTGLLIFSILVENFWCRYLCPYGALLGVISIVSPWKITRNQASCSSCGLCNKACSNLIEINRAKKIWSPECTGCLDCVVVCPVPGTLEFKVPIQERAISPRFMALTVIALWLVFIVAAKATGHWETSITTQMYKVLIPMADRIGL
ncbi:MAG: 4Fe-4S binding protein [Desulfitobacteriaceae bacterium]